MKLEDTVPKSTFRVQIYNEDGMVGSIVAAADDTNQARRMGSDWALQRNFIPMRVKAKKLTGVVWVVHP